MVQTGLDRLIQDRLSLVRDRRVGLITHPAAVLPDFTSALDALRAAGAPVTGLFGMEHGLAGAAADGAAVADDLDAQTRIPVHSLYGATREPSAAMLAGVDVLVFDVQDVGVRFYTFISTLYYALRSAGKHGVPVIVLDRPNPINGLAVEGPLLEPGLESFVGIAPMPIRHGLTVGELARFFNTEFGFGVDLTVIPMAGWRRELWFDETGLPWVSTSPGMPHLSTATVYPGTCLIEGTNLSEGRGTALPFEMIGAPWLDGRRLAAVLNQLDLDGVRFRPAEFIPSASKHAGQPCGGVQVHVTNRNHLDPVTMGLRVIAACRAVAPGEFAFLPSSWEGHPPHLDLLMGNARIREGLAAGVPVDELTAEWAAIAAAWIEKRRPYLLY